MNRPDWWNEATCRGIGFELFFAPSYPETETLAQRRKRETRAKVFCRSCPVRTTCLREALENNDDGIRGGTTPSERRRMIAPLPERRYAVLDQNWTIVVNRPGIASSGQFRLEQNINDPQMFRVIKNDETVSTHTGELEAWIALHKAT